MKKISLLFAFFLSFLIFQNADAQNPLITRLFYENFDGTTVDMTSSSTTGNNSWGTIDWLSVSSPKSDTGHVLYKDTIYLTTPMLNITGYKSISIEFDHIAKVDQFDLAYLQVSFDSVNWITLNKNQYQGPSQLVVEPGVIPYRFSDKSQPSKWYYFNQGAWVPSSINDFVHETFEISSLLDTSKKKLALRFVLGDNINAQNDPTPSPYYGWFIDNVLINGAPCRLVAPSIKVELPENYITSYIGKVYHEGPYDFIVNIVDAEGVDTAMLIYTINGVDSDTIPLLLHSGTTYLADIPPQDLADTICWKIMAIDATDCRNTRFYPEQGCNEFIVRRNLPKGCNTTPVDTYPYYQDFDGGACQPSDSEPDLGEVKVLCYNWENATGDFTDWFVWRAATATPGTGPTDDYPGNGKYLYVEASGHFNDVANMKSPCLDFFEIANPSIRFYVNTYGQSGGAIHVDLYTFDGPIKKDIIPAIKTSTVSEWRQVEINMYKYINQIVQLRFRGEVGNGDLSDLALDSFSIFYSPLIDVAALEVLLDNMAPVGSNDDIRVVVRNLGVDTITSGTLDLSINGSPFNGTYQVTWNEILAPNQTDTISVPVPNFQVPMGEFDVAAVIKVAGDEVAYNDTTFESTGRGLPKLKLITGTSRGYFDDFEDGRNLWTPAPFNSVNYNKWEFGYPNYGQTTGTLSGQNAWDILLNKANKNGEENSYLISPFLDLTGSDTLVIQFYQNTNINVSDLLFLEYSKDRGETWTHLENTGDLVMLKNDYNSTVLTPDGKNTRGWNGSTYRLGTDGQPIKYKLTEMGIEDMLAGGENDEVLIRFNFYDQAVEIDGGGEGISIENVRIVDLSPSDATPLIIHRPYSNCRLTTSEKVEVLFQNFSTNYKAKFPVEVRVHENTYGNITDSFTEVVDVNLPIRDTMTHVFDHTIDLSKIGAFYIVEVITNLANDNNKGNDTLRKIVENIDGCDIEFKYTSKGRPGYYQFYIDGKIPPYPAFGDFTNIGGGTHTDSICTRDDKTVILDLVDPYDGIVVYKVTSILTDYVYEEEAGGRWNIGAFFTMDCPPETDVELLNFRVVKDSALAPYSRAYQFRVDYANMGINEIRDVHLKFQIDNQLPISFADTTHNPALKYFDKGFTIREYGPVLIKPGVHTLRVWSENPNGTADLDPIDDTLSMRFDVIDTLYQDVAEDCYSTSFEVSDTTEWLSLNPYTYSSNSSFIKGTPSKNNISGAYDGDNAWVTDLLYEYRPFDSSSLVSPFIELKESVCYSVDFYHNYAFDDKLHDGGNIQYSLDTGRTWTTIDQGGKHVLNWYNTGHIPAMPDNSRNEGWTGITEGSYIQSKNKLPSRANQWALLRFNFESDGPPNGDGWAIDMFSMCTVPAEECYPVGIEELLKENEFILGQNRPNPFNTSTVIPVYLPESGTFYLEVMNMLGQPIYKIQEMKDEGEHFISLNTDDWAAGVYYYAVTFNGQRQTMKMMISR